MRNDPLQQFAKLKQQLTEEKSHLEKRLSEINQVLGSATTTPTPSVTVGEARVKGVQAQPRRRGRGRGQNSMSMREVMTKALQERGPLGRKELGEAVVDLGYHSKAKNVLGSIGNLLYGKNSPFRSQGGKFYLAQSRSSAASGGVGQSNGGTSARRKRRPMSVEARARIAEAQRARRAREKAAAK